MLENCWRRAQPSVRRDQSHPAQETYTIVKDFFVALPEDTPEEQRLRCRALLKKKEASWQQSAILVFQGESEIRMRIEYTGFPIFYLSSLHGEQGLEARYNNREATAESCHVVQDGGALTPLIPPMVP